MESKYHGKLQVQERKDHSAWRTRWAFDDEDKAAFYYASLNTWGKWRKRLIGRDGEVLHSQYPTKGGSR